MEPGITVFKKKLEEFAKRVRLLRTGLYALRFFLFGLLLALPLLSLRSLLPFPAPLLLGMAGSLALIGAVYGALTPLRLHEVAKLADARLHLDERLATALECDEQGRQGELVEALFRDAVTRAGVISPRRALPFHPRSDGKGLPVLLTLSVALLILPPVTFPLQHVRTAEPDGPSSAVEERWEGEALKAIEAKQGFQERQEEGQARQEGGPGRHEGGKELQVRLRDTQLSQPHFDFDRFLQGADDRLRLLKGAALSEQVSQGPSSVNHDASSHSQLTLQQMGETLREAKPAGPSEAERQRLLEAIEHFAKKGREALAEAGTIPNASRHQAFAQASQQLQGQQSSTRGVKLDHQEAFDKGGSPGEGRGQESVKTALSQRGEPFGRDYFSRKGKELVEDKGTLPSRRFLDFPEKGRTIGHFPEKKIPESVKAATKGFSPGLGAQEDKGVPGEGRNRGEVEGADPGQNLSPQLQGAPTARVEGPKLDARLPGESETYGTNLRGLGSQSLSRVSELELLSRYRRVMEETLSKEPIPFSSREQVKGYFMSLDPSGNRGDGR